jgi:uncharacterized protein YecT (DUF1311 family)
MKFFPAATVATCVVAALAAGNASAQLKAPEPTGPLIVTPAPKGPGGPASAPPQSAPQGGPQGGPPGGGDQPDPLSKDFRACIQKVQDAAQAKGAADPVAAQSCFDSESRRQEAKIANANGRLTKFLSPGEKKRLDEANVAWRRFRDAECSFFAEPKSSPGEAASYAQCVLERTIKRGIDLEGLSMALAQRPAGPAPGAPGAAPAAPAAPAKK